MTNSKYIAGLIGPTLMALGPSEAKNMPIWATNIAPVTYLDGTLLFIAGLSIVRAHSSWRGGWTALVTLTGWMAMAGGLFRMFAPAAKQAGQNNFTYAGLALMFAFGAFLTFEAYRPADRDQGERRG